MEADKELIESCEKGIDVMLVYVCGSPLVTLTGLTTLQSVGPFLWCCICIHLTVIPTLAA